MILQRNKIAAAAAAFGMASAPPAFGIVVLTRDATVDGLTNAMFVGGSAAGSAAVSSAGPDRFSLIAVGNDFP